MRIISLRILYYFTWWFVDTCGENCYGFYTKYKKVSELKDNEVGPTLEKMCKEYGRGEENKS